MVTAFYFFLNDIYLQLCDNAPRRMAVLQKSILNLSPQVRTHNHPRSTTDKYVLDQYCLYLIHPHTVYFVLIPS